MKIAQIANPWDTIPSTSYKGMQRVIQYLSEELVKKQIDVEIFSPHASTPWVLQDRVVSLFKDTMSDKGYDRNLEAAFALHALLHIQQSPDVDIVHIHSLDSLLMVAPFFNIPFVFTFHTNVNLSNLILTKLSSNVYFVFLSQSQRKQFPWIKNAAVIENGIPLANYPFSAKKKDYVCYIGNISYEKGVGLAIQAALKAKTKIIISGAIKDRDYFKRHIKPHLENPLVEYREPFQDEEEKNTLLKEAKAFLFPLQGEEAFSIPVRESMAVGTPVIAFARGPMHEAITDGYNGFLVQNVEQMSQKIAIIDTIDPNNCRKTIEERFTSSRMAEQYMTLYQNIVDHSVSLQNDDITKNLQNVY